MTTAGQSQMQGWLPTLCDREDPNGKDALREPWGITIGARECTVATNGHAMLVLKQPHGVSPRLDAPSSRVREILALHAERCPVPTGSVDLVALRAFLRLPPSPLDVCGNCEGRGRVACQRCERAGYLRCPPRCRNRDPEHGHGCPRCYATGELECPTCSRAYPVRELRDRVAIGTSDFNRALVAQYVARLPIPASGRADWRDGSLERASSLETAWWQLLLMPLRRVEESRGAEIHFQPDPAGPVASP
ncbi:MAG: hypothetical protein JWO05_1166 [Gemmatimonadetes bacterium]|nr:hypothetical protein [Gemmatimonadota bacterium]